MAKQNYGGVYANMEFAPYEYREYPKHIRTDTNGGYEVVRNAKEEHALLGALKKDHEIEAREKAEREMRDPARDILLARAKHLRVPVNKKWSLLKLQASIAKAEEDVDNLPAEDNLPEEIVEKEISVVEESAPRFHGATPMTESIDDDAAPEDSDDDEADDKDELIKEARSLGLNASRVWGIPKLKAAIESAKK